MDDQELRKQLQALHEQIEQVDTVDESGRELLRHLGEDIRELLQRTEGAPIRAPQSTVKRLEEAIGQLESEHPALTALLEDLLATLSNAGI